ncbi:MAG: formate--tetrahydrofolate ligase [Candidatus Izemoplasmatales bacterium]|nr:formate--tetrahydrofolate ligase [Candidatus Izemoplasmatales bacterium]
MKTDLEIAQASKMRPIHLVAKALGIGQQYLETYGAYKAKIKPFPFANEPKSPGKVILVTAITPTPAGEGKSTTTIGLGDALNRLGKKAMICLREPSLGPVMGVKGGAAGGGYAQVVPMEDINLHFTGDIHAITSANNLISAVIDNHLYHGNALSLDKERIVWKRAMDMNDRALRLIEVGRSSKKETPRPDGFDISVASEIMAVLCLSQNMDDLKQRLARMVVGYNLDSQPITAKDLNVHGAVAMLLKDALKPNLVQTLEHTPVFIHGGPFANIAHGCNSVIATDLATKLADYVVTEAGFGADLGMEKFIHIKAPVLNKIPSAVVLVASIRALKMHGGLSKAMIKDEDIESLKAGIVNLEKHIENIRAFDLPFVVALNHFESDSDAEVEWILKWAQENRVPMALSDVFAKGSKGGVDLAQAVLEIIEGNPDYQGKQLYQKEASIEEKVTTIARKLYGASHVIFSEKAQAFIIEASRLGWNTLPICMAKTPLSLSDNPKLLGRPRDFTVTIRDFKPSIGAGFIVALTGDIMTMPGLPKIGAFENMDVIDDKIIGLF